jgi:hypothetical protein
MGWVRARTNNVRQITSRRRHVMNQTDRRASWQPRIMAMVVTVLTSAVLVAGATAGAAEPVSGEFAASLVPPTETSVTLSVFGDATGTLTYAVGGKARASSGTFEGSVLDSDPGTIDVRIVFAGRPNDGRVVALPNTGTGGLEGLTFSVRTVLTDPETGSGTYDGIAGLP